MTRETRHRLAFALSVAALLAAMSTAAMSTAVPAAGAEEPAAAQPEGCICDEGKSQSPIDLGVATPAELPAIQFTYGQRVTAEVWDTGKSVQVAFGEQGRPAIAVGGESYGLVEFHFHHPSEHEVDGAGTAMELHFVHQNRLGELAVVGVLLEAREGQPHPVIEQIWRTVPEEPQERAPIEVVPESLLPRTRSYVRYAGSLTTAPCAEGVRWHVLAGRVTMSPEQVEAYRYPDSARDPQPLEGRPVLSGG